MSNIYLKVTIKKRLVATYKSDVWEQSCMWLFYYFNFERSYDVTLRSDATFGNWKPFKNNEKCFLFHVKRSFRSQDFFVLTFWSCRKTP